LTVTTYFRRVETAGTCGSVTSDTITKTVSPNETVTASIADPGSLCAGSPATNIVATGNTSGSGTLSYAWTLGGTAVGTNSSTYSYTPVIGDNGKVVQVVVSTSNACNLGPQTKSVTLQIINAVAPSVLISTPRSTTCTSFPSDFTAAAKDTGSSPTYQWYVMPSGSGTATAVGTNVKTYRSTTLATGDQVYVTVMSSLNCALLPNPATSNKITMTVLPVPNPSIVESDTSICAPGNVVFHAATSAANTTLQWFYNGSSINGATSLKYVAMNAGIYSVKEDNGSCNAISTGRKLNLIATPIANAGADQTLPEGTPSALSGSGGAVYNWSPSTYLSNDSISNPKFKATQTISYKLTVTDATGKCKGTSNVTVYVIKPISVPNVITVNGDGVNDTWEIENIHGYPNAIIEIYNRWGNLVWKTEGYLKNWDGSNFRNGEVLPDGTYFYIINLKSQVYTEPYTGWVQIIK
jgi:gliding motility-associated-like protein